MAADGRTASTGLRAVAGLTGCRASADSTGCRAFTGSGGRGACMSFLTAQMPAASAPAMSSLKLGSAGPLMRPRMKERA